MRATWLSGGKKGAISEHFLLIFLCLGQKRSRKKPGLNPGTRVSLAKVLANFSELIDYKLPTLLPILHYFEFILKKVTVADGPVSVLPTPSQNCPKVTDS